MAILDDVKKALRISHSSLDGEITDLIEAARYDLVQSGVLFSKANDDTDPLIKRAIILYCKAHEVPDKVQAERFQESYDMLKIHLSLSMDYNSFAVTFSVTDGVNPIADAVVTFNDQAKYTNSTGTAIFSGISETQNMTYKVTKDGYIDSDGEIDVESSQTVIVTMVVTP